ncbi:MAG: terminase family protein [Methanoregula sp.]|jgi:hypothetical protein
MVKLPLAKLIRTHPIETLETITGLTYSPFQREIILSNNPRVIVKSPRQSGKSESLVGLSLLTMLQGKKVVSFQPSVRQSIALIDRVKRYLIKMGTVPDICSRSEIHLDNGGSIKGLPIKGSSRGDTVDLVLFDEVAFIEENTDDDLLAIALPFLSKVGSRLVISSTPKGRHGLFYKIWTEENNFQKISGTIGEVQHYDPDFIESQRLMMGYALFNREFNCAFDELNEIGLFSELDLMKFTGGKTCIISHTEQTKNTPEDGSAWTSEPEPVKTSRPVFV